MATFFMFGSYTTKGLEGMSAERTDKAVALLEKFGGEVKAGYALLGKTDLIMIAEFPGVEQAMQASVALSKLTGIHITTSPAVSMADFDKLMAEV